LTVIRNRIATPPAPDDCQDQQGNQETRERLRPAPSAPSPMPRVLKVRHLRPVTTGGWML
jgi:hypothetical protein